MRCNFKFRQIEAFINNILNKYPLLEEYEMAFTLMSLWPKNIEYTFDVIPENLRFYFIYHCDFNTNIIIDFDSDIYEFKKI